jgi:hypothetical protein
MRAMPPSSKPEALIADGFLEDACRSCRGAGAMLGLRPFGGLNGPAPKPRVWHCQNPSKVAIFCRHAAIVKAGIRRSSKHG